MDGNTATAWVEGASGQEVGEVVMIPRLDLDKPIQFWNGYGKSEKLYQYNSRVKKARMHIFRGKFQGAGNCGAAFKEIIKVASLDVNLLDRNGFQPLGVPTFQKDKFDYQSQQWDYSYWLAIEIVSVYPGSKWADTCISEVRNN